MSTLRLINLGLIGVALILASSFATAVWLRDRNGLLLQQQGSAQVQAAQLEIERARSEQLRLRATLLAANGATMAYIADAMQPGQSIDTASISDLLGERREQLGLDAVGVIDVDGRWITGTRPWTDSSGSPAQHPLFQQAREQHELAIGLVRDDHRLFLGSVQPIIRAGAIDAYLYAANEIDAGFLAALAALAPVDLALVTSNPPARVIARSGEGADQYWLGQLAPSRESGASPVTATAAPLFGANSPVTLLWKHRSEPGAGLSTEAILLVLGGFWSLLWLLALIWWWRGSMQAIDFACDLLERAAMGDFHLRAPAWPSGRKGRFATAFDSLMLRINA
jgi:hypothetical protein